MKENNGHRHRADRVPMVLHQVAAADEQTEELAHRQKWSMLHLLK